MSDRRPDDTIRAVDLFCGAGGLTHGLAQALESLHPDREKRLAAVNHWGVAIETHKRNHPWADHYNAPVEAVRPRDVFDTERVDILVGGPECTHHSRARGGRPVDDQKRMSPWVVLEWLQKLYVDAFVIENVPEFENWGPVGADGHPLDSQKGETFDAWIDAIHALGYNVDWRVLNAADYGDATTRRRLFVIGRRKRRPEWPDATHDETGAGDRDPWRPAAEVVDVSDEGKSIWTRGMRDDGSRPLANSTMCRIADGLRRYADDDLEPFADALEDLGRQRDIDEHGKDVRLTADLQADIVSVDDAPEAVADRAAPFLLGQHGGAVARETATTPCPTIATGGAISLCVPEAFIMPRNGYHRGDDSNPAYRPDDRPLHTVTASNHDGHLVTPYLVQYNNGSGAQPLGDPLPTATTKARFALVVPDLFPYGLDIRFRMLRPRELAAAMGFPPEYDFAGTKTERTAQIGNAVPVNLGRALCERLLSSTDPTLSTYVEVPDDD